MSWPYLIIGAITAQRAAELIYSRRNTRKLRERGALEKGRRHYSMMVILHAAWLIAVVEALPRPAHVVWPLVLLLAVLQLGRLWTILSLGPYWTTRILTVPGDPLVRTGPYRFLRHPNYLIVVVEIAALPLAFGETKVAVVFSLLNALMVTWRIRREDAALESRRALGA